MNVLFQCVILIHKYTNDQTWIMGGEQLERKTTVTGHHQML